MINRYGTGRCRHGFSLIELLTVLAIIAVLAGLLLPGVRMVKSAADSARCASRLGQLQLAVIAYASDWNGLTVPLYEVQADSSWAWWLSNASLADMVGEPDRWHWSNRFTCPESRIVHAQSNVPFGHFGRNVNGFLAAYGPANPVAAVVLPRIWATSESLSFSDALDWITAPSGAGLYYGELTSNGNLREPAYRHNGSLNAAFWDGHVASLPRADVTAASAATTLWRQY